MQYKCVCSIITRQHGAASGMRGLPMSRLYMSTDGGEYCPGRRALSRFTPHTQQLPGNSRQLSKTALQSFALMQNFVLIFRSNKLAQINSKASLYFTTRTRHTLSMAASFSAIASSTGASVSTRVYANSPRALLVRFAMLIPASPKRLVIWAIILGTLR